MHGRAPLHISNMRISPPGHLPGDPDAPSEDFLGLAVASVLFGILIGAGVIAAALWAVRTLQIEAPAPAPGELGGAGLLLLGGTMGGLVLGAGAAWTLMAPITSYFRRGGLAILTGFATLVVSLVAVPVDRFLGRPGLAALAGGCALGCLLLSRFTFSASVAR